ncbi:MAG TPA: hypothetical protein PLN86_16505, partial [Candidatus Hydrogenedentes bacterium]|nr:hypothetical protein [Candidatus Hydrogenedentota bacterium]
TALSVYFGEGVCPVPRPWLPLSARYLPLSLRGARLRRDEAISSTAWRKRTQCPDGVIAQYSSGLSRRA